MVGYIYLLECSDGTYKIGATKNNINKRIKSLQTGNPNKIILKDYFKCKEYFKVEKALHRKYRENTETFNEWRYLTEEQIANFKEDCEILCDNMNYIYENNEFLRK